MALVPEDARPVIRAEFRLEEMDGEMLAYSETAETLVRLNATGLLVWNLCDGERTTAEIVELLAEQWPEAEDAVRRDVRDALEGLAGHGLLTWA